MKEEHLDQPRDTSCEQCRRAHRKCDRSKPSCMNCVRKQRRCTYTDPSKAKSIRFTDVTSTFIPSLREDEMARKSAAHTHVDLSYEKMSYFVPVIAEDRARNIMEWVRDIAYEYTNAVRPSTGELALVFAIQATSYSRAGKKRIANLLYAQCRQTLLPVYYSMSTDFEVAACHACISQYLLGLCDISNSKHHLDNAQRYFDNLQRPMNLQETCLYLSTLFYAAQVDVSCDLTSKLRQMVRMVTVMGGAKDPNIDYNDPAQIDDLYRYIFSKLDLLAHCLPVPSIASKKIYLTAIAQGIKIQILKKRNADIAEMLPFADCISELIANEYFSLCHGLITVAIMEAAEVHMKVIHESPTKELMARLKEDLRGLMIMRERHEVVQVMYDRAIQTVRDFVRFNDNVFESVGDFGIMPSTGGIVIVENTLSDIL
jgi:hypothetical protein